MDILVSVVNQKLRIPANLKNYVEGSQKFVRFVFDLSSEWDDLQVFAQFSQNGKSYNLYLDNNNSVYLPPEIVAGVCTMTLYGTGGNIVATTNDAILNIESNSFSSNSSSTKITTSLYNQLADKYKELNEWKLSIEADAPLHWIEY